MFKPPGSWSMLWLPMKPLEATCITWLMTPLLTFQVSNKEFGSSHMMPIWPPLWSLLLTNPAVTLGVLTFVTLLISTLIFLLWLYTPICCTMEVTMWLSLVKRLVVLANAGLCTGWRLSIEISDLAQWEQAKLLLFLWVPGLPTQLSLTRFLVTVHCPTAHVCHLHHNQKVSENWFNWKWVLRDRKTFWKKSLQERKKERRKEGDRDDFYKIFKSLHSLYRTPTNF